MPPLTSLFRSSVTLFGLAVLAATLAAAEPRNYSFTDATADMLTKYKTMVDAKNYDGALALLDGQITRVPADSYDAAMLYQIKTQTLLQKGDFDQAVGPTEKALALSEAHTPTYFEDRATSDLLYFLTQLFVQQAVAAKDHAKSTLLYEKGDKTMQKWLQRNPKSTPDAQLLYSQLLYTWAVLNPEKPDVELIKRALEQVEVGLHLSTHPKDTFYVLKLVCLQQLNRLTEAAEMFELLIKLKPESATYYQQLAATYLSQGQDLRAALTIERAQAYGHMNTPQYTFNLVGIYFNTGQYEKAADLLEAGLKAGTIENELKNWELLALSYQQLQEPLKGIESLKAAAKSFPNSGQLEFLIAQAYHGQDKSADALPHLQAAVAKGGLAKPHEAYLYLAYVAFELKKFDIALEAAKKAAAMPEGAKDGQNMVRAIEDQIKDREAKKDKM